jgi:hypothetical protein
MRQLCESVASVALGVEGAMPVVYAAARSMHLYLSDREEHREEALVFLTVSLTSMARHMAMRPRRPA